MAASDENTLDVATRTTHGSRGNRRLRRTGRVPAVVYGGGDDPVAVEVDARVLRNALAHSGAVIELSVDGGKGSPVMLKDAQRHPVRGEIVHADFLRVRMDQVIHTTVALELTGADDAPGITEGGVLSQEARELNVEALPGDIPDVITVDVSGLHINDTLMLDAVTAPPGVTLLDDPETTVIATVTPPTAEPVEDDIETETGLVGSGDAADEDAAERQASGDTADEAQQGSGGDTE